MRKSVIAAFVVLISLPSLSAAESINQTICSEWNGFFPPMVNVMEHVNVSSSVMDIETVLYDIDDQAQGRIGFSILANGEFDLLVHELPGWRADSYGKVCSTITSGQPVSALHGKMVYYRGATGERLAWGQPFDFIMAIPFSIGKLGKQFVTWNTIDPRNPPRYAEVFVANWVHIRNMDSHTQTGRLTFFGHDGDELDSFSVTLPPGARRDFAAHAYGQTRVGLVSWVPDDSTARFQVQNQRYFYDNPNLENTFNGAFSLDAQNGTTDELGTFNAYAFLEIANVSADTQTVTVDGPAADWLQDWWQDGPNVTLAPFASKHTLHEGSELSRIKGSGPDGIVAFHIAPYAIGDYAYPLSKATADSLTSSYNTFQTYSCWGFVQNMTSSDTTAILTVYGPDGSVKVDNYILNVPALSYASFDPCYWAVPESYGQFVIRPAQPNTLIGYVQLGDLREPVRMPLE